MQTKDDIEQKTAPKGITNQKKKSCMFKCRRCLQVENKKDEASSDDEADLEKKHEKIDSRFESIKHKFGNLSQKIQFKTFAEEDDKDLRKLFENQAKVGKLEEEYLKQKPKKWLVAFAWAIGGCILGYWIPYWYSFLHNA
jgi:hypothetical protein